MNKAVGKANGKSGQLYKDTRTLTLLTQTQGTNKNQIMEFIETCKKQSLKDVGL
jgi:hypothetical protein